MKNEPIIRALGAVGDDLVLDTARALGILPDTQEKEDPVPMNAQRKIRRAALIAAALAVILAATALAAGLFSTGLHPVEGGLSGEWGDNTVTFPDTQLYLTFESDNPRHEVTFKPGWLPSPPTAQDADEEGFGWYFADEGEGSYLPYLINSYNRANLQGSRYTLNGRIQDVRQDTWKNFERTEIEADYSGSEHITFTTANYIILFDTTDNYMIQIAGTADMATLEKIAENLEIRVGDVIPYLPEDDIDLCWFDLGRG